MEEWTRPTTKKQVQRYCGIINFFRRFIPNVSEKLYPIMSRREKKFAWNDEMETSFQQIKNDLLHSNAFLNFPVKDVQIELATDASNVGIGATLFQRVKGEIRYLGFHSRVLRSNELNYSVPKKELLSIIYHMNYYKHYLAGNKFKLHTDSRSLAEAFNSLEKQNGKSNIIAGWLATIANLNFEVYHIPGKLNTLPDLLSRVQSIQVNSIGNSYVEQLLKEAHSIGHWGANAMYQYITVNYPQHGIKKLMHECLSNCKRCMVCQQVNHYRVGYAPLRKPKHCLPGEHIHIDLMEMKASQKGYSYVLMMIDKFSGFVWMKPLLTKSQNEVADEILKVFLSYGFPKTIKSDNGKEFCNTTLAKVCKSAKVIHNVTIAYDHKANGRVERANRTARITIKKIVRDLEDFAPENWENSIAITMFAINCRFHSELKSTPFSLMFGRGPFNLSTAPLDDEEQLIADREKMVKFWATFKKEVPDALHQLRLRNFNKKRYRHHTSKYDVGDMVMLADPNPTSKDDPLYNGPYEVTDITNNGHYVLQGPDGEIVTPADRLKLVDVANSNEEHSDEEVASEPTLIDSSTEV